MDPKNFGLPARTVLEQLDERTIAIVVDRKSRILLKDGHKLVEKAEKIRHRLPEMSIKLKTTAPVCSKTVRYLKKEGVDVFTDGD